MTESLEHINDGDTIDQKAFLEEIIYKNLSLRYQIKFRGKEIHRRMIRKDENNQPSCRDVIEALEETERDIRDEEKLSKSSESQRNDRNNGRKRTNEHGDRGSSNQCRIGGHNHEWKNCPDNPANKKAATETSNRVTEEPTDNNTPIQQTSNFATEEYWRVDRTDSD